MNELEEKTFTEAMNEELDKCEKEDKESYPNKLVEELTDKIDFLEANIRMWQRDNKELKTENEVLYKILFKFIRGE